MKPRGLDSVRFPHKRGKECKNQKKKKRRKPRPSQSTEKPYFYEPRHNKDPVITKKHPKARQNYSKIYGNESRYNEIPAIMNRFWRSQRTISAPVTNILSGRSQQSVKTTDLIWDLSKKHSFTAYFNWICFWMRCLDCQRFYALTVYSIKWIKVMFSTCSIEVLVITPL